jgi:hypothetical protein
VVVGVGVVASSSFYYGDLLLPRHQVQVGVVETSEDFVSVSVVVVAAAVAVVTIFVVHDTATFVALRYL